MGNCLCNLLNDNNTVLWLLIIAFIVLCSCNN